MSTNLCEGFNTTQQMLDTYRNLRTQKLHFHFTFIKYKNCKKTRAEKGGGGTCPRSVPSIHASSGRKDFSWRPLPDTLR